MRLLPGNERAEQLLGEEGAAGAADVIVRSRGAHLITSSLLCVKPMQALNYLDVGEAKGPAPIRVTVHRQRSGQAQQPLTGCISRCCCKPLERPMRSAPCSRARLTRPRLPASGQCALGPLSEGSRRKAPARCDVARDAEVEHS